MSAINRDPELPARDAPIEMSAEEFRRAGHRAIDAVADFLGSLRARPVTPAESPSSVRALLGDDDLPAQGTPAEELVARSAELLFAHSLFNGHPRFFGFITSSAAPIGALGDLLAAAVNPNVGGWMLSPLATEVEAQTIRWIAELIGYPASCGGLLVSGGNMANFVALLAARRAKAPWDVRSDGLRDRPQLTLYASEETHTWIQKAADLFGFGTEAIRWIRTDRRNRLDAEALERQILADRDAGHFPLMAVGTAGTVGVGAIDPLPAIAEVCSRRDVWFHVDGAYGAPAALLDEAPPELQGIGRADSVAVDPHKWLYSPLEAGCVLVREPRHLLDAFSFHPEYYHFENSDGEERVNYHEYGPQNSRGFRALKVWLGLKQVGREGYARMIRDDCALARALFDAIARREELEPVTQNLSITTFRFVPADLAAPAAREESLDYINELNRELLGRLQRSGEAFVSNAVVDRKFLLRACIVNFRTTLADVRALPELVLRLGRQIDSERRPAGRRSAARNEPPP